MYNTIMIKNKILSFIILAIATFSASIVGGLATYSFKEPWYSTLKKSSFNPPDWVFAPVWTTLYLFMTIAIWSAWHKKSHNLNLIYIYFIHLFFNTTWSIIFFVILLIKLYYSINKISAYLMLPYLSWLCFAFVLNYSIFTLN